MFGILDTSSVLNCSPRITREMLELSNFLLPSHWASMPLGGFVPDSRTENEVALATKRILETEKRFCCKTSKSSAWLSHLLGECLESLQLEKFISPPHAL